MAKRSRFPVQAKLPPTNGNGNGSSRTLVSSTAIDGQLIKVMNNDRMLFNLWGELSPREMTGILRQAVIGNLVYQERLFQKMIDEWSRLGKNILTLKRDVSNLNWTVNAFAEKDEAATESAQEKAALVERALFGMVADGRQKLRDFHGMLKDLVSAVPMGFSINEIMWTERDGEVVPANTKKIPARYYGYSLELDKPDMLMLNPLGNLSFQSTNLSDFPENKFLIGIFEANENHPSTAAMLRGLVPWFMGSKFGLKWFMIFAQMFGIPTRIAKYTPGDETVKQELISMLERMAEANYGAFPTGVDLELIESKIGGSQLPQRELINDANDECDIAILGQTLTSSSGHAGGNRALGEVHADTKDDILNGTAGFVADVINTQLIPAILMLNYGEVSEAPKLEGKTKEAKDELAMVQRDAVLFGSSVGQLQLPVSKEWMYQRHGVPEPADDAELYTPPGIGRDELFPPAPEPPPTVIAPPGAFGRPGGVSQPPEDKGAPDKPTEPAKATASEPLVPSIQMAMAVKKGLDLRKKQGRGGALSAVARARDIAQRKALNLSTVQRMRLYFDNNPLDAKAEPDSPQGISYALHGGNTGRAWVEQVCKAVHVQAFNPEHDSKTGEFSSGSGSASGKATTDELLQKASSKFKLKGIDNKETTCTHCGKEELKRVMWIEHKETGEISAVGTSCGAKLLGLKNAGQVDKWAKKELAPEIKDQVSSFKKELQASPEHAAWNKSQNEFMQLKDSLRYSEKLHGDFQTHMENAGKIITKKQDEKIPLFHAREAKIKELHEKYPLARMGMDTEP